ncbi:Glycosaminoglycan xylosylkinase [Frankliniella fusca]|uniref:Glycosaminoglycan xylosylkinase n=1 Tax=Frankliniella fusca TaxID=407009 RepID=A0AAE1LHA4_9NEOP|nr:Glycosaminoglycan xylosylkinase [Frankliniella fusca]
MSTVKCCEVSQLDICHSFLQWVSQETGKVQTRIFDFQMSRHRALFLSLFILIILVLLVNFYFAFVMNSNNNNKLTSQPESPKALFASNKIFSSTSKTLILLDSPARDNDNDLRNVRNASLEFSMKIEKYLQKISFKYSKPSPLLHSEINKLWTYLQPSVGVSTQLLSVAKEWVGARNIVPAQVPLLGSVLKTISVAKIIKAQNAPGGTQLKLLITFEGGQQALFKPQWYKRDEIIEGPVYSGKDRHNAEVAAFYLALLLGLRRVPITAARKINLQTEIMPVASKTLLKTFIVDGKNNTCFYGTCHYCSPSDAVCGSKVWIEGAVILMLPNNVKLKHFRSPWQRTYKENKAAKWEIDSNFCETVKSNKIYNLQNGPRLLDLIDAAVFDFLIDNGDRHHYEVPGNVSGAAVLFIDNGKSFGHPFQDHWDILAPLYQCCVYVCPSGHSDYYREHDTKMYITDIFFLAFCLFYLRLRKYTWERLLLFSGGTLGAALEKLLSTSFISPVLTSFHLNALNRRLRVIYATAEFCFQNFGIDAVLIDDGYR